MAVYVTLLNALTCPLTLQVLVFRREGWTNAEEYCCRVAEELAEGQGQQENGRKRRKEFVKAIMVQILEVGQ